MVLTLGAVSPARAETFRQAEHCLAQTMYWEARAEGPRGMMAVGWVVLNRLRNDEFPGSVCGVVRQSSPAGCQFSYWCDGRRDVPKRDAQWREAQEIARQLLSNPPPDPTRGAVFYHAVYTAPPWKMSRTRTARIGHHVYYR